MRRVVHYVFFICSVFVASGCELQRERRPSVLVVAVEGLGFETLSCDSELTGAEEGLRAFCEEAVRFSHAYAPSTLSQPTMTSLLTGLYPVDHGVRNNGRDFLSAKTKTLAEAALARSYRTLFVSGGPPIWRKSGLAQGFEIFDDQVDISPGLYYRPAEDVFKIATHWMEHDADGQPFLGVLFLADLQFPQVATRTDEGEMREKSAAAQLEEITESLAYMVRWLKAKKLWNSTNVILVGLNSLSVGENDRVPAPLSLRSDSVQVSLFIKPARKERDNVIQWAVDRGVSLVDVGVTMFEWLGSESQPTSLTAAARPQSLSGVLVHPEPGWSEDRLIVTESAWPEWLDGAGVRWAIRQNQLLYIHDRQAQAFNTLTDRMESMALRMSDPLWISLSGQIMRLVESARIPPFGGISPRWLERIEAARELWRDGSLGRSVLPGDPWLKWHLRQALAVRDWKALKRLAHSAGDAVGAYVAARHLGEPHPLPKNSCLRLLLPAKGERKESAADCDDEKALDLLAWQGGRAEEERQAAQDRFLQIYRHSWIDQDVGRLNYLGDLRWDVRKDWPEGPQLVDYVLTLKEWEPYAKKVSALLAGW